MVLTIAASHFAGMEDNSIMGRVDLRLRFSIGMYCLLPTDCGRMCTHLCLMVMMAMVMGMMMVSVMVIIVPEALRQVGLLRQR
jgi:hypothetical protein